MDSEAKGNPHVQPLSRGRRGMMIETSSRAVGDKKKSDKCLYLCKLHEDFRDLEGCNTS